MPQDGSHDDLLLRDPFPDTELTQLDPAHWQSPRTLVNTPETQYSGIFGPYKGISDAEPLKQEEEEESFHPHHWETERPHLWKTILIQTFAVLWLVPILSLLIVNIKRHVLGASAWCPFGHCLPRIYDESIYRTNRTAVDLPAKFDRSTHNILGALQFVAKALEVWFIIIATWLVYLVTTWLANRPSGLPIGYFSRPSEFAEVPSVFDPLLWSTLRRLPSSQGTSRRSKRRLVAFVVGTLFLCLICNLMGPAVAVLVLPTLQWIETPKYGLTKFEHLNANAPPSAYGFAAFDARSSCSAEEITVRNFSCAGGWSGSLASWIDSYAASQMSNTAVSVQDMVSFTYNTTYSPLESTSEEVKTMEPVTWIPNRQTLSMLSRDLYANIAMSGGYGPKFVKSVTAPFGVNDTSVSAHEYMTFVEYNSTVQTFLRRNGPILGALANAWAEYDQNSSWTTIVDDERSIRCYPGYNLTVARFFDFSYALTCIGECSYQGVEPLSGIYTRCIPIGRGWGFGYKTTGFSFAGNWHRKANTFAPNVSAIVHASDKAAFLPDGEIPKELEPDCLVKNARIPSGMQCDWTALWMDTPDLMVHHRSKSVTTVEFRSDSYSMYSSIVPNFERYPNNVTLVMDFVAFQTFADYILDPSYITNPLFTADYTLNLSKGVTLDDYHPVSIDPAWTQAAWTADLNQSMTSTTSARSGVLALFDDLWLAAPQGNTLWSNRGRLPSVGFMPILQTLSLIDYNTSTVTSSYEDNDPLRPLLQRNARINVYAYGISGRTSWLGVVVTSIGCVVVLLEVAFGLYDRRRFRSLTQLLVAALEHSPTDEFRQCPQEKLASRVRFRLQGDFKSNTAGKLRFEKVS